MTDQCVALINAPDKVIIPPSWASHKTISYESKTAVEINHKKENEYE